MAFKSLPKAGTLYNGDPSKDVFDDPTMRKVEYKVDQEQKEAREGFLKLFDRATQEEWIERTMMRHKSFSNDENFSIQDKHLKDVASRFKDEAIQDYVLEARSEDEFNFRVENASTTQKNREALAANGFKGAFATLSAAMLDPAEWAAFAGITAAATATTTPIGGGVAAVAKAGRTVDKAVDAASAVNRASQLYKANRRSSLLRSGAIGAGGSAASEGIRAKYSPDIDEDDVMMAILFGGATGAGMDALGGAYRKAMDKNRLERRLSTGEPLTSDELKRFAHVYDQTVSNVTDADVKKASSAIGGEQPSGRPINDTFNPDTISDDLTELEKVARQRGSNLLAIGMRRLFSSVARGMDSDVGAVRSLAQRLGLNATGNKDGSAVTFSASEYQGKFSRIFRGKTARALSKPFREFRQNNPRASRADFNVLVTQALRNPASVADPAVRAAADAIRPLFKEMNEAAGFYKVRGWNEGLFAKIDNYVPRIIQNEKVASLVKKHGKDNVIAMVRRGISQAQSGIDEELLDKLARGYVDGILDRAAKGRGQGMVNRMRGMEDELTELRIGLARQGMSDAEIDAAVDVVQGIAQRGKKNGGKAQGSARTRSRLLLDESAEHRYFDADGNEQVIKFDDMLNNDVEELMSMYTHQVGGSIGLAKNGIEVDGGETFESLVDRIRKFGLDKGVNKDKLERELQALEYMYDSIKGTFQHSKDKYMTESGRSTWRRIRALNYIRSMGSSGLAAIVETGSVIGEFGMIAFVKKVPEFRRMVKMAKDGKLSDKMLRDIEQFTGLGTDIITGRARNRYDEIDTEMFEGDYTRTDQLLDQGQEFVGKFSGLGPVTVGLRRMAATLHAEAWEKAAKKGKSPFARIKMEQLGITAPMEKRIMGLIKKNATYKKDGTLESLNLEKWGKDAESLEAREAFTDGMYRDTMNIIQETSLGNTSAFMRGEVGKTVFQFLSFVFGSAEQQTQRLAVRAVNGDAQKVFTIFASTAAFGAMSYVSRVYLSSMTMSTKEGQAYRDKYLQPHKVIEGSLGMMGTMGIYSTLVQKFLSNGSVIANPTLDLGESIGKSAVSLFDYMAEDEELTEKEWRTLFRIAPFYTLFGVRQIADGFAAKLAD